MIDLEVEADVEHLIRALSEIGPEARGRTMGALDTCAEMIRDHARAMVPVDTGSLQRSIRKVGLLHGVGVSAGGHIRNPRTGKIVDYARHLEYGTSKTAAKPFLRPAYAQVKPTIIARVREAWRTVMEAKLRA